MSAWPEVGWRLVFGIAALVVTFNYRDVASRVHGFMAQTVGVSRLLTPATVRGTCGFLAVALLVELGVGLARS